MLFWAIMKEVASKDIMTLDIVVYRFISTYLISDIMTPIAKFITNFGGTIWLILMSIVLLIVIKNKKIAGCIFCNLPISALINFIIKQILQRPRPNEFRIIEEKGFSFPSGHSMVSMAVYGFFIYLIFKFVRNKVLKTIYICFFGILIFSIGISRIYLGVHYTSDVIGGYLIAISYLIIYTNYIRIFIFDKKMLGE